MRLSKLAEENDVVHLLCEGEVSQLQFGTGGNPLERTLGPAGYGRKVLLNMERADFIDSSGISWLVVAHKHFRQNGGALVLHSLPPRVLQVLQLLKMPSVLHIAEDEQAARGFVAGGVR